MFNFLEAASRLTTRTFDRESAPSQTFFQRFSKTNLSLGNGAISTLSPLYKFSEEISSFGLAAQIFSSGNVVSGEVVKYNQYGVRRAGVS